MSEEPHSWKVTSSVNGWEVRHSGPTDMRFRPDQYGRIGGISFRHGHGAPPLTFEQLRDRVKAVHPRLLGKRFGDRFSDRRRNVCCEYAAELNEMPTRGNG